MTLYQFMHIQGLFVGAFVSSNLGDVSPNLAGPRCLATGRPCSLDTSACDEMDICVAQGPGKDMFDSTKIIGERIFNKALVRHTSIVCYTANTCCKILSTDSCVMACPDKL